MGGVREHLADLGLDEEALFADGFDDAIVGVVERFGMPPVVLYNRERCISILMEDGLDREDAEEHFSFNVIGAWVGEYTPAFATLL